jgi:hypothetical protein
MSMIPIIFAFFVFLVGFLIRGFALAVYERDKARIANPGGQVTSYSAPQTPSVARAEVPLTIKATPVFRDGQRIFVEVNLTLSVPININQDYAIQVITPLAKEQIALWAVSFEQPELAYRPDAYRRLKDRLLALKTDYATVSRGAVMPGGIIRDKSKAVSVFEEFVATARSAQDLKRARVLIDNETDPEIKSALERMYEARLGQLLDKVVP